MRRIQHRACPFTIGLAHKRLPFSVSGSRSSPRQRLRHSRSGIPRANCQTRERSTGPPDSPSTDAAESQARWRCVDVMPLVAETEYAEAAAPSQRAVEPGYPAHAAPVVPYVGFSWAHRSALRHTLQARPDVRVFMPTYSPNLCGNMTERGGIRPLRLTPPSRTAPAPGRRRRRKPPGPRRRGNPWRAADRRTDTVETAAPAQARRWRARCPRRSAEG